MKPENNFINTEKDITVYLYDGKVVTLQQGDYSIMKGDTATILKGKGVVRTLQQPTKEEDFDGEINFIYIEKITTKTYPVGSNGLLSLALSPFFAIASVAVLVIIFIR